MAQKIQDPDATSYGDMPLQPEFATSPKTFQMNSIARLQMYRNRFATVLCHTNF